MALPPGTRLGVYHVIGLIDAGGMGEVYRARDERLERDVAVKVLPDLAGSDRARIARFEREARALATLSHPNIAVIHGLEEVRTDGPGAPAATAIVMELVEGETLADRLQRGALPLDEALAIAGQIADALEAAHEKGIIHRDLKPANVRITPAGIVKVLDFGLAKVVADAAPDLRTATLDVSGTGMILGTPAYMAPEQAQGRPVDRRADVWAFGVLLYEMIAGRRPFAGASLQETLTAVLTAEPDWSVIPPRMRPLLRRCLERDPRRRLRDVGDFAFVLEAASGGDVPAARRSSPFLRPALIGLALAAAVLAAAAAWQWARLREDGSREPVRLTTLLPASVNVTRGPGIASSVALSPDGRTLVVAGTDLKGQRLYRRPLDRLDATPLAGTERGSSPFFSWDGAWVGFFADGRLKRVPAAGGAAVDIVAIGGFPSGATWGPDDRIVYAYGADAPLHVVDAAGGEPERLTELKPAFRPAVTPDGRTVLFESGSWIHAVDLSSRRQTRLVEGTAPHYLDGHIVLRRGGALMAAPVDLAGHRMLGAVVPLVDGVAPEASTGGLLHYSVSRNGSLAYVPAQESYQLVIVSDGSERVVVDDRPLLENPRFSPDGRSVVVAATRRRGEPPDLWIHDLATASTTRLTAGGGRAPLWTSDDTVTYSHLGERRGIYAVRANGREDARQLVGLSAFHWLVGWTPERRTLAYGMMEGTLSSIMAFSDGQARRVVGPGQTWGGRLSPDGRWLAYYSLDSGNFEVLVTPFPEAGPRWPIAEGTDPAWSPDGAEIYYRSGARLMAARVETGAGVRALSHRVAVEPFLPPLFDDYDIHPDGRTLIMVRPGGHTRLGEVALVVDWLTEVRQLIGK